MHDHFETVTLKVQSVRLLIKVLHLLRKDHHIHIELSQGVEDLGKVIDACRACRDRLLEKAATDLLQTLTAEAGMDSALAFHYLERLRRPMAPLAKTLAPQVQLHSKPPAKTNDTSVKPSDTTKDSENTAEANSLTITLVYRGQVLKKNIRK